MDPDELELQMKARARMRMTQAAPPTQSPGFLEETGNVLGGAAVDAGMALATIPGGVDELARHIARWIEEKRTGQPQPVPPTMFHYPKGVLGGEAIFPTPSELKSRLETDTGLKAPEAKTPIGKAIQGPASLAMQSLIMPGNALANVGKYAVAPTIAATAAEKLTGRLGGSEADREMAAAAAGIGVGGAFAAKGRGPVTGARDIGEIHDTASATLNEAKSLGIKIAHPAVDTIVARLDALADDFRAKPYTEKEAHMMLEELRTRRGADLDWADLMKDRGVLRRIERNDRTQNKGQLTSVGEFAGRMVDEIDKGMGQVDQTNVVGGGDPVRVRQLYKEGNKDWKMYRDAERIDDAFYEAEISNKTARGDHDGAVRDAFRKIAKRGEIERFSPEAQSAILDVVKADKVERAQRFLGKFSPEQRPWSALLGTAVASSYGAGPAALAIPALGAMGNAAAGARTLGQAQRASAISRGGIQEPNNAILRFPALIPGLGNMATQGPR